MSIIKDWKDNNQGYRLRYKLINFISPREWLRLHKWRKQRADRGWSDRDAWAAGEYIVEITADIIDHLHRSGNTDWEGWFKSLRTNENYKDISDVVKDLKGYSGYNRASWYDDLTFDDGWVDSKGKKLTEKQITTRIKKWSAGEVRACRKASKAMQFFGRHFWSFWD